MYFMRFSRQDNRVTFGVRAKRILKERNYRVAFQSPPLSLAHSYLRTSLRDQQLVEFLSFLLIDLQI